MDSRTLLIMVLLGMAMMLASASSKLHVVKRQIVRDGDIDLLVDDNEFLNHTEAGSRRTLLQQNDGDIDLLVDDNVFLNHTEEAGSRRTLLQQNDGDTDLLVDDNVFLIPTEAGSEAGSRRTLVDDNEFLMPTEGSRRTLVPRRRYISYGALRANRIPCGYRGSSYYDCQRRRRANPYNRGCTAITRCQRRMSY